MPDTLLTLHTQYGAGQPLSSVAARWNHPGSVDNYCLGYAPGSLLRDRTGRSICNVLQVILVCGQIESHWVRHTGLKKTPTNQTFSGPLVHNVHRQKDRLFSFPGDRDIQGERLCG